MRLSIIIGLVVAVEMGCIAWLGLSLYEKQNGGPAAALLSIAPLHKADFVQNPAAGLKYFYEPKPDSEASNVQPSWLSVQPKYSINDDSLRDSVNHPIAKPEGTFRIVLLGDSFTYGLYVNEEDTYGKKLEQLLAKECTGHRFEVLNLGVQGYDLTYAAERFKERGVKYDPDMVIWLIKRDDMMESMERMIPLMDEKLAGTGRTTEDMRRATDEVVDELRKEISPADLFALHTQALQTVRGSFKGTLLLYAPWQLVFQDPIGYLKELESFDAENPRTARYFSPIDFAAADLYPDGHPRAAADAQIAQDLFSYLTKHQLVPCT